MKASKKVIPKIIHQIWIGDKPIPAHWMETVKEIHPGYEYKLWTEKNIPTDLVNQKQYDEATYLPQKADILRYELLYRFGGIYVDADCVCIQSLEPLRKETSLFLLMKMKNNRTRFWRIA